MILKTIIWVWFKLQIRILIRIFWIILIVTYSLSIDWKIKSIVKLMNINIHIKHLSNLIFQEIKMASRALINFINNCIKLFLII